MSPWLTLRMPGILHDLNAITLVVAGLTHLPNLTAPLRMPDFWTGALHAANMTGALAAIGCSCCWYAPIINDRAEQIKQIVLQHGSNCVIIARAIGFVNCNLNVTLLSTFVIVGCVIIRGALRHAHDQALAVQLLSSRALEARLN